ncbi:glycosidase crf2 [Penicillium macrosclerotiorum]|uniref:glycosidase crf2 n=1 Tax=Penicillium macrosclerotiorum TaxID=303699 RepID=UPI0025466B32|nr:glycosidase crf2 [Penicillium macrosclerotiorum]KAJ5698883.1 glycosidase crf2 [Penicillium macrosclerotiorum]
MVRFATPLLALTALSATALATTTCSTSSQCPEDKPCCSQYGECGTGAYCLGGCDIQSSFSIDSCAPMPVCEDKSYTWDNLDNTILNTKYLGDASEADWTYSGYPKIDDGSLLMTMPKNSVGTLFANNHYIWYGKISGKIKSSRGAGVVTAFILLSDVKDEIDYEFVGADLSNVQTNYYWQGVLDWHNSANASIDGGDSFDDWHTYEIDWQPDQTQWSVDGEVKRTLKKSDTWNSTANRYQYPQTPARLQMSIWPAGQASNAEGTIAWAGGEIDWDSTDIQEKGYYYATIGQVDVTCYSAPSGTSQTGNTSYVYTSSSAMEADVEITSNSTVLGSLGATGLDMTLGANSSSSATASASDSVPSSNGGSGGMASSNSGSSTTSSSSSTSTGFSQGNSGSSTQDNGAPAQGERVLRGSLFAVLVAVVVLVTL